MDWDNRKFQYGDGFFETIIVKNGSISYWTDHFKRIAFACETLQLQTSPSFQKQLKQDILTNAKFNNSRVKIQFWRSGGGKYTPNSNHVEYHIEATKNEQPFYRVVEEIAFCDNSQVIPSVYSSFKCILLPYIIAANEKHSKKVDDLILINNNHKVAECISSNLFWYKNETFFTPSLSTGCLNGVMRTQLLNKLDVEKVEVDINEIKDAESIFCSNVTGITQFKNMNDRKLKLLNLEDLLQEL